MELWSHLLTSNLLMMFSFVHAVLSLSLLVPVLARPQAEGTLQPRQTIPPLPGTWSSVASGCYTDNPTLRTLSGAAKTDDFGMTVEACLSFCGDRGFIYAGVEFGKECFCDIKIANGNIAPLTECNQPCSGNPAQSCGAPNRMNIFWSGTRAPNSPPTVGNSLWKLRGCFRDSVSARILPSRTATSGPVTPESCANACRDAGMPYMGLEYGFECWCGSSLDLTKKVPDSDCSTICTYDHSHLCGNADRLTVYYHDVPFFGNYQQTCVGITSPRFRFSATYKEPPVSGPRSYALKVVEALSIPGTIWSVLSACPTCISPWEFFIYAPENNVLVTQTTRPDAPPVQVSIDLWDFRSPLFATRATLPSDYGGYAGYCEGLHPLNPSGPHILIGNGNPDKWSLCPNISASGRLDVVMKPALNHPHYDRRDCGEVDIFVLPVA